MGVLTDFVVADKTDAKRVGDSMSPSQEFGGVDAMGILQVQMGTLYAILTGHEYDPEFLTKEESFLYSASEEGPWVQLVPHDMVLRLARLTEAEVPGIAERWGRTEEFNNEWDSETLEWVIQDIAALSRTALQEGKTVLMWTCL